MVKRIPFIAFLITVCAFSSNRIIASEPDEIPSLNAKKNSFYFYWGYNRSAFSKSDIHFEGPNYNFTVYNVTASDRPSEFGEVYFQPKEFSIPQYNYRLGYFITDRFAVSVGMDHMKYVVDANQVASISGYISPAASKVYAGSYQNTPIRLTNDFLMFEHTNGFNFLSLDAEYVYPLKSFKNNLFSLHWNAGAGGVFLITKTDVRVMGDGLDNRFSLSGYAVAAKTGPRIEFMNRVFIAAEGKAGFVTLPDVLIKNDAPERADHNVFFYEFYVVAGVNFKLF